MWKTFRPSTGSLNLSLKGTPENLPFLSFFCTWIYTYVHTFSFLHNWIDTVCTVVWLDVFHITCLIDLSMHLYLGLPNFISYVRNHWLYHHLFNLPPTDKYLCFYTLETFPMFHIYKYVPSTSCTFIFEHTCHNTVKWKKRLQIYIYSPHWF